MPFKLCLPAAGAFHIPTERPPHDPCPSWIHLCWPCVSPLSQGSYATCALCWLNIFKNLQTTFINSSWKQVNKRSRNKSRYFRDFRVLGIIRNTSITKGMFRISLFLLLLRLSLAMKELCDLMRSPKKANHRLLFTQDHPESDCSRLRLKGKPIIESCQVISSQNVKRVKVNLEFLPLLFPSPK